MRVSLSKMTCIWTSAYRDGLRALPAPISRHPNVNLHAHHSIEKTPHGAGGHPCFACVHAEQPVAQMVATRNTANFDQINGLTVVNPWKFGN